MTTMSTGISARTEQSGSAPDTEQAQQQAWHKLGLAALARDDYAGALRYFAHAVTADPADAAVHTYLGYTYLQQGRFDAAIVMYGKAIELDPGSALAYHGLANVYEKLGNRFLATQYRQKGLTLRPVTVSNFTGTGKALDVLLLGTPAGVNIETRAFFDTSRHRVHALAVDHFPDGTPLPAHDVVFNGIGDADAAHEALRRASSLLQGGRRRTINHPDRVLRTGRADMAAALAGISGIHAPAVARLRRSQLCEPNLTAAMKAHRLTYPFLLRVPGYHTGEKCVLVTQPCDAAILLQDIGTDEYFAIEFVDVRAEDELVRKYRAMFIDGRLYPIHLAITGHWKAHYFSAQTASLPQHLDEEDRYLRDFEQVVGDRHLAALQAVEQSLGLEYGGVDFGFDRKGNLTVFEANANMGFAPPSEAYRDAKNAALTAAANAVGRLLQA